jgi:hypothetical protein
MMDKVQDEIYSEYCIVVFMQATSKRVPVKKNVLIFNIGTREV